MLSGRKRVRDFSAALFSTLPSRPVRRIVYTLMYGFESGATDRTSMRALFSLPSGMRTIEPRSIAEALIWFGASKCGSRRRYAFTDEFNVRQMSCAFERMREMKSHPDFE